MDLEASLGRKMVITFDEINILETFKEFDNVNSYPWEIIQDFSKF